MSPIFLQIEYLPHKYSFGLLIIFSLKTGSKGCIHLFGFVETGLEVSPFSQHGEILTVLYSCLRA
jgi:hypothetical protein